MVSDLIKRADGAPSAADSSASSPGPSLKRHTASHAILASDAFSILFESSGEALLLTDFGGTIQRANSRARYLLALKNSNPHGLSLASVLAECSGADLTLLCDSAATKKVQSVEAALVTGHTVRITLRAVMPGSESLLLCLEEGSVVQRAEEKWRRVEAELRSVLDSVATGILLLDAAGRVRFSSARLGQLFGIDARSLGQLGTFDELSESLAQRFRNPEAYAAPWRAFAEGNGEPMHDELEMLRPTRRVIERFSRPVLDREGRAFGWLELYSDVTGERQIQSKMLQTEKMAALGQLVSGIAHELNNPLTAIMGYAQLLLVHGLNSGQLSEAKKVYSEAERARRIVKNLLYFARENKPERSRADVNEIIERTLALRGYELKVENIVVDCDLASDLPRTMADPYQLQQVILNLVVNAEQALVEGRGQGHVWIRTSHLRQRAGDRILIEISDDGPGIAPEIASRIFDPFFTTKPPGVGTGLGLSIVYGIVHQHGGEITLDSQRGLGARFTVELPVVAVPATERPVTVLQPVSGPATRRGRILVIEDEPTVAQLIVDVLREEGHQVEAVLDSTEGLTRISRASFDLVICDLRMPRLDGPAFYEALVRSGSPMQKRILFITGDTVAKRTLDFLEPNRLPYLAKPFLVEELKLAVNRLLEILSKRNGGKHAESQKVSTREAGD
ncbi:MAG TPA: ATP-binding protein [Candidatus Limnocylindrales bacterium]|nr:ATP-binding protein [Candidatus Limnocylindrales bacterium]